MELDTYLRDPRSRRSLFRGAGVVVAGSSATFLAACGGENSQKSGFGGGAENADTNASDVEILNSALDLEHMAVAAYTAGAKLLKGDALKAGKRFLGQEREHADALTQAIKTMKGKPNRPRVSYDLPKLGSQTDVLRFATDLENTAVAAYIDALPKLTNPDLRATAAAILTNEAEHIAVLLGAQGKGQVPTAFVKGKA